MVPFCRQPNKRKKDYGNGGNKDRQKLNEKPIFNKHYKTEFPLKKSNILLQLYGI